MVELLFILFERELRIRGQRPKRDLYIRVIKTATGVPVVALIKEVTVINIKALWYPVFKDRQHFSVPFIYQTSP